jgi:hypothetical protein
MLVLPRDRRGAGRYRQIRVGDGGYTDDGVSGRNLGERVSAGNLIPHTGFLPRRVRLLSGAHAPDPGAYESSATPAELGPSGGSDAPCRTIAIVSGRAWRGCRGDITRLPPSVVGAAGLAAETRAGSSGQQRCGRSRRRGFGGACACLPAAPASAGGSSEFRRAQPAACRGQALRPAACADRHAAQPRPRDRLVAGRGRGVPSGRRGCSGRRPGCDTAGPPPRP